jgi:hypothetical protein
LALTISPLDRTIAEMLPLAGNIQSPAQPKLISSGNFIETG